MVKVGAYRAVNRCHTRQIRQGSKHPFSPHDLEG